MIDFPYTYYVSMADGWWLYLVSESSKIQTKNKPTKTTIKR